YVSAITSGSTSFAGYSVDSGSDYFTRLATGLTTTTLDGPGYHANMDTYTPGMALWNESLWAAYAGYPTDELFLTSIANNGSGTVTYHGAGPSNLGEGFIFPPSVIGYNGSLHVFYTQEAANGESSSVLDGMYDGRAWSQYTILDDTSGHF